jgi:hypothetical protein
MNLITDDVRALIGVESEPRTAKVPLSEEMLRRFVHGVMEENTVHCDPDVARKSRYGQLVAPPLFPIHAFRRPPDTPDPLDALHEDPFDDGTFVGKEGSFGLPAVRLPLRRRLNGGTEAELFQMAKIGDVITARSKYVDIQATRIRTATSWQTLRSP